MENAAEFDGGVRAQLSASEARYVNQPPIQQPVPANKALTYSAIFYGVEDLRRLAGATARNSGWHADRPVQSVFATSNGGTKFVVEPDDAYAARLRNWQGMKIMLMVSELSEGVEELRKGHDANHTYYPVEGGERNLQQWINGVPQFKPEGLPSELADTVIRIMDFCFTEEIPLGEMILEKLQFNATRGQKHGGKAI